MRPDLILMDIVMPDMDGLEVIRRLKTVPQSASTPVTMISGKSEGNIILSCMKADAVDFVVKPFKMEKLKAKTLRGSLAQRQRHLRRSCEYLFDDEALQPLRRDRMD